MLNFFGLFLFINECDLSQGLDSGGFRGGARALIFESNWLEGPRTKFFGETSPPLIQVSGGPGGGGGGGGGGGPPPPPPPPPPPLYG